MPDTKKDIDHALVEGVRPPIYAAMKYWGKKPHNIWREYINTYASDGGTVLDPFAGSAIAAFEAVKSGRKAVAFDINPITSFLIEAYCTEFKKSKFNESVNNIISEIAQDVVYKDVFSTQCDSCGAISSNIMQHCKWEDGEIYEMGVVPECKNTNCQNNTRYLRSANDTDRKKSKKLKAADFEKPPLNQFWVPVREFHESPSFSANFINKIGGRRFLNLWTGRNLYVLSKIFDLILLCKDKDVKRHLLLGFIQTLHLCSKMCVSRRSAANRPYSTSWGRSAYICANRQMEMNPLLLFSRNCLSRQSVQSSVSEVQTYIGKIPNIMRVEEGNRGSISTNYDIKYGIVNAIALDEKYVTKQDGVKFIITDPPYGGLVQYLDLSSIWLVWLEKYDPRYTPDYGCEITIKQGVMDLDVYQTRMNRCFRNMSKLLPDDGKIIFTFHNKNITIWNAFLRAVFEAGLIIEKVIHQPNKRTGESNVANPYGTSANDFYLRCVKARTGAKNTHRPPHVSDIVVKEAISIIAMRNEPTPYQILFNGLLSQISMSGFRMDNFDGDIQSILRDQIGKEFVISGSDRKHGGALWWLANPNKYIKHPDLTLSDRVRGSVLRILRGKAAVSLDEALAEIYINYPNGMTPDIRSVQSYLAEYATKSQGQWIYKGDKQTGISEHTDILRMLAGIGRKMNYQISIGKREMPEQCGDKRLSDYADSINWDMMLIKKAAIKRIAQIDMLWVDVNLVAYAIEVENTTSFVHGIHRASNLGTKIPKIMVIPDNRLNELKRSLTDNLTFENFNGQNWRYITYSSVRTIFGKRHVTQKLWEQFLCALDDERKF